MWRWNRVVKRTVEEPRNRDVNEFTGKLFQELLSKKVKLFDIMLILWSAKCKLRTDTLKSEDKDQAELIAHAPVFPQQFVLNSTQNIIRLYSSWFHEPFFLTPMRVTSGKGELFRPIYFWDIEEFLVYSGCPTCVWIAWIELANYQLLNLMLWCECGYRYACVNMLLF